MSSSNSRFTFIDIFAGIGGFRLGLEELDGKCVFSSEWNRFSRMTYSANFGEEPAGDIRNVRASDIPDHDLLAAGFPCQPFSIAGVSKKNSLGMAHGFKDLNQGNLFFEILRILEAKRPRAYILENVKNLEHHDGGKTFKTIVKALSAIDYSVSWKIIDASSYVPQHRERIFIVGFDTRIYLFPNFEFPDSHACKAAPFGSILEKDPDGRYILTDHLWNYLQNYAAKHKKRGNGFTYGLVDPAASSRSRTLSARYYKDGSEILIARHGGNPRRLTPRECARLMGFPDSFVIPVSDTQAYRQFGNAVVPSVVKDVAAKVLEVIDSGQNLVSQAELEHVKNPVGEDIH